MGKFQEKYDEIISEAAGEDVMTGDQFIDEFFTGTMSVQDLYDVIKDKNPNDHIGQLYWGDCYSDGGDNCNSVTVEFTDVLDYVLENTDADSLTEFGPFEDDNLPVLFFEQSDFEYDYDSDDDEDDEKAEAAFNEYSVTYGEIMKAINQIPKKLWPYCPVFGRWEDNGGQWYNMPDFKELSGSGATFFGYEGFGN